MEATPELRVRYFKESQVFAVMGRYINDASRLELAIDEWMWAVVEHKRHVAKGLSKKFPRTIDQKLNFYRRVMRRCSDFWSEPIYGDGYLHATALCRGIEEVFFFRNLLAHGAVDSTEFGENSVVYTASKIDLDALPEMSVERYKIRASLIIQLSENATVYRFYFDRLVRKLNGKGDFESEYKQQSQIADNRKEIEAIFGMPWNKLIEASFDSSKVEIPWKK